ncbi:MAG TPA: cupin domain-containing protein [Phnomibacter sp.]|nr:cupin domain-containing protein [Phnomibacter sp.]
MQLTVSEALEKLKVSGQLFTTLFEHGSLSVEIYKPSRVDFQQPHQRDEIYVVLAGSGIFHNNGQSSAFHAGDFLFVPAGQVHRFMDFTEDFCAWVFFYGPIGGEKK